MIDHLPDGGLRLRVWTPEEFASSSREWEQLLAASDADPLFNSWDWQWRWWQHCAPLLNARLRLIAAYNAGNELIGIAPFFLRRARHKMFESARLELLGGTWRCDTSVFSEYLDLPIARGHEADVITAFARFLWREYAWSDLVMSNVKPDSMARRLAAELQRKGAHVRPTDPLEAHATSLPASFEEYLGKLSSGTRRKLWNQRKKLPNPVMTRVATQDLGSVLDAIDEFHCVRWGKRQFTGVIRRFHEDFAAAMGRKEALRMTLLHTDAGVLAAMYNVRLGDTEYNIQSGFDAQRIPGLSPGYLHFGYCIEQACADGLRTFDWLGGTGQHRQYKEDLLTRASELITLQVIRSPLWKILYRLRDTLRKS